MLMNKGLPMIEFIRNYVSGMKILFRWCLFIAAFLPFFIIYENSQQSDNGTPYGLYIFYAVILYFIFKLLHRLTR